MPHIPLLFLTSSGLLRILGLAALLAIAGLAPRDARAAVMTFAGADPFCGGSTTYVEDGIAAFSAGGVSPHLDDTGTPCSRSIEFTAAGPFDAVSALIVPHAKGHYCLDPGAAAAPELFDCSEDTYENVRWEGFAGGSLVASDSFWMGEAPFTYVFGEAFRDIDALKVSALYPQSGTCFFNEFCQHFDVGMVTLDLAAPSVIPLPAGLWLLLSALAVLARFAGPRGAIARRSARAVCRRLA